jgi:hypothetical protein
MQRPRRLPAEPTRVSAIAREQRDHAVDVDEQQRPRPVPCSNAVFISHSASPANLFSTGRSAEVATGQ